MHKKEIHLDGKGFYYAFLAGAKKILENQKELNKINVYPVPDADTGSNLASTIRTIIEKVRPNLSYKITSSAIAAAAIEGARGNSGIIFAQFLYGIGSEACDCHEVTIPHFAQSLLKAVRYMYEAISNPVEGTMITVIRKWAEYMDSQKEKTENFLKLLADSHERAAQALQETRERLAAMKKANVVDAGSKGMVLFLEGMIDFLKRPSHKKVLSVRQDVINIEHTEEITPELVNYRYCAEALLKPLQKKPLDKEALKEAVQGFGDSLVIAGSDEALRMHIHTDTPAELFYRIRGMGKFVYQKADDMRKQYETAYRRKWNIALVTDSCCDLPQSVLDYFQVHMVPITLNFGENLFLDKLTVMPDQFYRMLDEAMGRREEFPKTAQPNVKTFENLYSHLVSHYDSVIAVHLSEKFSGTCSGSRKAAELISKETGKKITVIDSKTLSGSLGLLVFRAAKAVEAGRSHEETARELEKLIPHSKILVAVNTLKYMVGGGRVHPMAGVIANILHLKPIVSMKESGEAQFFDKAFSQKGSLKNILRHMKRISGQNGVREYCILHAHNPEEAAHYAEEMEKTVGKKPDYIMDISPVIGLNAGVGAVAVSFLTEPAA